MERLANCPTGHRDCCGDMVHEGDTVISRNGQGRIHWIQEKWWLMFSDLSVEALNRYPAKELRRLVRDGTKASVPGLSHETTVPGQQNDCPAHCPTTVPQVKCSQSVGYINNGTVGQ